MTVTVAACGAAGAAPEVWFSPVFECSLCLMAQGRGIRDAAAHHRAERIAAGPLPSPARHLAGGVVAEHGPVDDAGQAPLQAALASIDVFPPASFRSK